MENEGDERVRRRAYEIWEADGRSGDPEDHWRRAEREIIAEQQESSTNMPEEPSRKRSAQGGIGAEAKGRSARVRRGKRTVPERPGEKSSHRTSGPKMDSPGNPCTVNTIGESNALGLTIPAKPDPAKETNMRQSLIAIIGAPLLVLVSSAIAQTTAPGTSPGTPAATGGGLAGYWWLILLILIAAAAVWYFMKGRNRI